MSVRTGETSVRAVESSIGGFLFFPLITPAFRRFLRALPPRPAEKFPPFPPPHTPPPPRPTPQPTGGPAYPLSRGGWAAALTVTLGARGRGGAQKTGGARTSEGAAGGPTAPNGDPLRPPPGPPPWEKYVFLKKKAPLRPRRTPPRRDRL